MNMRSLPIRNFFLLFPCVAATAFANEPVDDARFADVRGILKSRCISCHGPEKQEAGLRLDQRERALQGSDTEKVIIPKKAEASPLLERVTSNDPDKRMPPEGKPLSSSQIEILRKWIDAGAIWPEEAIAVDPRVASHWAYQSIREPSLPEMKDKTWPRNGIDAFILHKLEQENVKPSPAAQRSTLIRRVFLDLIGLPPAPDEWIRWIDDPGDDWYDRMVDHLLSSPHYGERWARNWLDQARYADTDGYEKDSPRPHAFNWRDWVIDAINSDLPFDQFSEQQIAGDLLPGATPEVRLATGFHRNTLTNREGGIDKEEDRVKQVVDRINTVCSVWLGLTVKCAQCHSHKYDQISQREYFQLFAFFNNADEQDFALTPTKRQRRDFESAIAVHTDQLAEANRQLDTQRHRIVSQLASLESRLLALHPGGIPKAPVSGLRSHLDFDRQSNPLMDNARNAVAQFHGSGEPTRVDSRKGSAIKFNGKDQQLELGNLFKTDSHSSFTLSAWVQFESGVGGVITKMDEHADFRGIDFTNNQGMLEVHLVHKWPTDAIKVTTKGRIKPNQWQHVLAAYDGSKKAAGVAIFIDGNREQLDTHYDTLTGSLEIDQPFRVASRRSGTFFKGMIDDVRIYDRRLAENEVKLLAGDPRLASFLKTAQIPIEKRSEEQQKQQIDFGISLDPEATKAVERVKELQKSRPVLKTNTGVGMLQRQSPRRTFLHIRGDFLQKGEEVRSATPKFLPELTPRGPVPDRLDLARWIFSSDNSLTPRVMVNRVWQEFFGRGLVESDQDFGSQGSPPTHPELHDWLASRLVKQGWSMKNLHRLIVTSATYRQSSHLREELSERDPNNHWLARQNRLRVSAETVRDLALATSGLLDCRISGPSVFPPLPAGVIELAFVDVINRGPWRVSSGGDRYRRGLYTFFQRTSPYPMLSLFDAPDSNTTCTRREKSNTPLQALTVWNDPVFMECARAMARRIVRDTGTDFESNSAAIESRIRYAFVLCLGYDPSADETADARRLYEQSLSIYAANKKLTDEYLGDEGPPESILPAEFAAWISLARTLINLDGFITRD